MTKKQVALWWMETFGVVPSTLEGSEDLPFFAMILVRDEWVKEMEMSLVDDHSPFPLEEFADYAVRLYRNDIIQDDQFKCLLRIAGAGEGSFVEGDDPKQWTV